MCSGCGAPGRPAHSECLRRQRDHRPNRRPIGKNVRACQCVEVDFKEHVFAMHLLDPTAAEPDCNLLHIDDVYCTWIGLPPFQNERLPNIYVWPRLQRLLQGSRRGFTEQYPGLVSFIGSTGSGKSTLIQAMMHMVRPLEIDSHDVPVPGSSNVRWQSTSSGVHVYADPDTLSTKFPTLYAGKLPWRLRTANDVYSLTVHDKTVKASPATKCRLPSKLCQVFYAKKFLQLRLDASVCIWTVKQQRMSR